MDKPEEMDDVRYCVCCGKNEKETRIRLPKFHDGWICEDCQKPIWSKLDKDR